MYYLSNSLYYIKIIININLKYYNIIYNISRFSMTFVDNLMRYFGFLYLIYDKKIFNEFKVGLIIITL